MARSISAEHDEEDAQSGADCASRTALSDVSALADKSFTRDDSGAGDASALQSMLRDHLEARDASYGSATTSAPEPAAGSSSRMRWVPRLTKSIIGLALLVVVGWMPAQRLIQVSSVEAVVNARLVTMRAPINGVVGWKMSSLQLGSPVSAGSPVVEIANPRVDRHRFEDASARLSDAREERAALAARLEDLTELRAKLAAQLEEFRQNRILQLSARIDEANARIAAAGAISANAEDARARHLELGRNGISSAAAMNDARRDATVAEAAGDEARAERNALVVEFEALLDGVYLGDSYNDQPRSAQRLDEISETIDVITANIARQQARIVRYQAVASRERAALAVTEKAPLSSPVAGRVWEILTAPGEQVVAGQPLISLLNCSQTLVTAVVSEAVYNSLFVGMPAKFSFREGGESFSGRVVQLSGVSEASSNFAIMPSALKKESYRVAVSVDDNSLQGNCPVGRTGRVVFDTAVR